MGSVIDCNSLRYQIVGSQHMKNEDNVKTEYTVQIWFIPAFDSS